MVTAPDAQHSIGKTIILSQLFVGCDKQFWESDAIDGDGPGNNAGWRETKVKIAVYRTSISGYVMASWCKWNTAIN
jgi:hypothetical protein